MKMNYSNHSVQFTVIELLVCIAIVAILFGMTIPVLSHIKKKKTPVPLNPGADSRKVERVVAQNGKYSVKVFSLDWKDGEIREITDTETKVVYTIYSMNNNPILLNTVKDVSLEK